MGLQTGTVDTFFETGCEGLVWAFYEDGKSDLDAIRFIETGDRLVIYSNDGSKLFDGEIIPDYHAGWTEYPKNPGHGQPSALGYWIHWSSKAGNQMIGRGFS